MRVVIGGCGRVGALLTGRMTVDGNEVAIIDRDPKAFKRLPATFTGATHVGAVFDKETLEAAGIDRADAYVAVTSGDNSNIVSALVAKDEYRVPRVMCRIYDPRREEIYRRLGMPAFSSSVWAVNEVLSVLLHPEVTTDLVLGDGEVRVVSLEVPRRLVGRQVSELERTGDLDVVAIVRAGRSFLPSAAVALELRDIVYMAANEAGLIHLESMSSP